MSDYVLTCCSCGIAFGMPSGYVSDRRKDHVNFYCPNGHAQHFSGQTEAERLQKELEAEKLRHGYTRENLERTAKDRDRKEAQRRAEKAAKTVLRRKLHPETAP